MTPALSEAVSALPPELREPFLRLVEEYNSHARDRLPRRQTAVHYGILSDLVLNGWRKAADPHASVRPIILDENEL